MMQRLFITVLCALSVEHRPRCVLNTRTDFVEPLPVIIRDGNLLEPTNDNGNIILNHGDSLVLSCVNSFILHSNAIQELSEATINCVSGDIFENSQWLSFPSSFRHFRCIIPPPYISLRTNRSCYAGSWIYEVGYQVGDVFYPVYESCFNVDRLTAYYSKYTQKPYNSQFQTRVVRPFFIDNDVYGNVPVNSLFSPPGLRSAVAKAVGSKLDYYIDSQHYLSRGHLAAKTDFVLAFGQRATFHYVNCAPQWVGFNGGNWNTLEVDLRTRVHDKGWNTVMYTGTYGELELMNAYGKNVQVYLTNQDYYEVIRVPKYFYKIVYEPSSKRGVAFVGINNPHCSLHKARSMFFCADLCRGNSDFSWLTWHPDNATEGYSFCCNVGEFLGTVSDLPQFEVSGLLV